MGELLENSIVKGFIERSMPDILTNVNKLIESGEYTQQDILDLIPYYSANLIINEIKKIKENKDPSKLDDLKKEFVNNIKGYNTFYDFFSSDKGIISVIPEEQRESINFDNLKQIYDINNNLLQKGVLDDYFKAVSEGTNENDPRLNRVDSLLSNLNSLSDNLSRLDDLSKKVNNLPENIEEGQQVKSVSKPKEPDSLESKSTEEKSENTKESKPVNITTTIEDNDGTLPINMTAFATAYGAFFSAVAVAPIFAPVCLVALLYFIIKYDLKKMENKKTITHTF